MYNFIGCIKRLERNFYFHFQGVSKDAGSRFLKNVNNNQLLNCITTTVGYWSEFLATDPEVRVQFPALPNFLRSSGSGTGSTQPR
jgi:hypothetical protein